MPVPDLDPADAQEVRLRAFKQPRQGELAYGHARGGALALLADVGAATSAATLTGGGDEDEEDAAAAGRAYVPFGSQLLEAFDGFLAREDDVTQEANDANDGKESREKQEDDLMREAMSGKKTKKPVRRLLLPSCPACPAHQP